MMMNIREPREVGAGNRRATRKALRDRHPERLTPEQIDLGSRWLGLSNLCSIFPEPYQLNCGKPKDVEAVRQITRRAFERAVIGAVESAIDGSDRQDHSCSDVVLDVEREINMFRKHLKQRDNGYWVAKLRKEIPCLFETR